MPPPAFGKGNAFRRDLGVNEKFVELSRKSAQAVAARASVLDQAPEREVIDIIRTSALTGPRKTGACTEVRKALKLCRSGIDPKEEELLTTCSKAACGHEHAFLCLTRKRKPTMPEKEIAERVWTAIDAYLRAARSHLQPLVRAQGFTSRACLLSGLI